MVSDKGFLIGCAAIYVIGVGFIYSSMYFISNYCNKPTHIERRVNAVIYPPNSLENVTNATNAAGHHDRRAQQDDLFIIIQQQPGFNPASYFPISTP